MIARRRPCYREKTGDALLLATIEKNSIEDVRVRTMRFNGAEYVDIRVFSAIEGGIGDRGPTRKGVTLRLDVCRRLAAALTSTLDLCER